MEKTDYERCCHNLVYVSTGLSNANEHHKNHDEQQHKMIYGRLRIEATNEHVGLLEYLQNTRVKSK